MHFSNPLFLFGLFALLIPIVIHLFNFRRYKTLYFSNVKMLSEIVQKTRHESKVRHLIILLLRILGIAALVIAFAQPYLLQNDQKSHNGNLVTIFLDNSFSMSANAKDGPMLQNAIESAKDVVNAFSFSDDFILVTQNFSAKSAHILNKDEILNLLDEIEITPEHKNLDELFSVRNNIAVNSKKENQLDYFISDFQKSNFNFSQLPAGTSEQFFFLPLEAEGVNNVAIDSCSFTSPVFKKGQEAVLNVRLQNHGDADIVKLPLKLYVNGTQQAIAAVDIKAHSTANQQLRYTLNEDGLQCGMLSIEDAPIVFDDKFYFVYEVTNATEIIAIQEEKSNRYLKAMYGYDSLFVYTEMRKNNINYSQFKDCQLVILDQLKSLSSGLMEELSKFVKGGGNLLVFPSSEMELNNFQQFLSSFGVAGFEKQTESTLKIGRINEESLYFKDALQKQNARMSMPTVINPFALGNHSENPAEVIMSLENGASLLTCTPVGEGRVFLSAVALEDAYGDVHKNALFFVPLHNIAIFSQRQGTLYNIIGRDDEQAVKTKNNSKDEVLTLKAQKGDAEFIPGQKNIGGETRIFFHDQVTEAGLYDLRQDGSTIASLAFNFSNEESALSYYSESELKTMASENENSIEILSGDTKNLAKAVSERLNGTPLWRYFVLLALLCFLAEIILLRFGGKEINNQ